MPMLGRHRPSNHDRLPLALVYNNTTICAERESCKNNDPNINWCDENSGSILISISTCLGGQLLVLITMHYCIVYGNS